MLTSDTHAEIDGGTVDLVLDETQRGQVAHLKINHTARRNAMGPAVIAALTDRAIELGQMVDLRLVTIRGTEGIFSAGANVKVMAGLDPERAREFITSLHRAINAVRNLPVPVIAVLEGRCYGAAMELAAACDMRIAASDLTSGMPEVRVGLPSVIEACLLPRLIGWGLTSELLLTGRDVIGEENLSIRFVERLAPPGDIDACLAELVASILAAAPAAVRAQKNVMRCWHRDDSSAIQASIDAFAASFETGEPAAYLAQALKKTT